jgi:predicted dehydrogenase
MIPLKVAVVGIGQVAQNNYLPYLSKEPDVSLGYLSRTRAKTEAAAAEFGGQVFDSPTTLMAWAPDTVFILTREMDRFDAAMCRRMCGAPASRSSRKPSRRSERREYIEE